MSDFADGWMTDTFSNSSDYCTRDLTIDLTSEDVYGGIFSTRLWSNHNPNASTLCSNKAFGCREQTREAFEVERLLDLKKEELLSSTRLMNLWDAMNSDNSSSAA